PSASSAVRWLNRPAIWPACSILSHAISVAKVSRISQNSAAGAKSRRWRRNRNHASKPWIKARPVSTIGLARRERRRFDMGSGSTSKYTKDNLLKEIARRKIQIGIHAVRNIG